VEALVLSSAVVNSVILFILMASGIKFLRFSFKSVSKAEIKEFASYGGVSVFVKLGLLVLMFSDRYVIKIFDDFSNVGIYNQVYNLGQISLATLAAVFFSAVSPKLNRELESNISRTGKLIRKYLKLYLLYMLPLTVYLSLFAREVAFVMLGREFRSGYNIIPYIMISSFVSGITMFHDVHLKFSNRLRTISAGVLLAVLTNIILNFIFIPLLGYKWAAITTLISYLVMFLYYSKKVNFSYFRYKSNTNQLGLMAIVLIIQVAADLIVRKVLMIDIGLALTIIEGVVFLLIFMGITNARFRNSIFRIFTVKKPA
jgi:O-antigen/teichoic acid export membrane protein